MRHIKREHAIMIALPIDMAFPVFTPLGEMLWLDDWRPVFIHPANGETQEGMVFTTGEGEEFTIWSCIDWAPERYYVRYARVTPASRFAHVSVECKPAKADHTRVMVRYDLAALNENGQARLDAMTTEAFTASIDTWKALIETRIA